MGMSPATASSTVHLPLQAQTTDIPPQGTVAPLGPASSPLQPRNLLADIDQTQHDEASDDSNDSETFDALTPSVDYESWSADQVRKECTRRGLKLKASMKKGERIDVLRRQDVARATYDGILLGDEGESASTNAVTKWAKHCWYRLLNILFSDEFSTRFSQSGDMASRAELDSKSVNDRSRFWQEVRAAFVQQYPRTHERNLLLFEDDMFAGADPSVTRSHSASKLLKMSKEVIKNYFIAEQKFTTSGQNEDEFWKFVDKRGAVLYMRKWLTLKPDLINFVKGGFLSEDEEMRALYRAIWQIWLKKPRQNRSSTRVTSTQRKWFR
ncbi:hypothetical protein PR003_g25007 [Phytophthora rubi]|uniref:Uncharacterized protein n=1 Tax=Phytophthora rubi TaxID=129364 RepID=A0A6A4CI63_9STRA|nr:hypothetical protein PR003_g25007 [Phytophthora rubi]